MTTAAEYPYRMIKIGGRVLHAARERPSGAFETACGYLSGPGDDKRYDDGSPPSCRACNAKIKTAAKATIQ